MKEGGELSDFRALSFMNKKAGVFSLVNTFNNFRFIDCSTNIDVAIKNTYDKLEKNKHKNLRLQEAWDKYKDYFQHEILEYVDDKNQLIERKTYWINYYKSNQIDFGYNLELLKRPWEIERENYLKSNKWIVTGNINNVLGEVLSQLNFDLKYAKERLEFLNNLLTKEKLDWLIGYFSSPGFINKQIKNRNSFLCENDKSLVLLSNLADYLVFPKYIDQESEFKDKEIKMCKSKVNMSYINEDREILVPNLDEIENLKYKIFRNKSSRKKKFKVIDKQEITENDINNNEYINRIYSAIDNLNKLLNSENTSSRDKHIIKKTIRELKKDAIIIKDSMNGTIYFKKVTKGSTVYNFDEDTGYFNDKFVDGQIIYGDYVLVSENKIDFKNKKHIQKLLNYYPELKEKCGHKVDSDIWHILFDFENLLKSIKFKDYIKDILVMKINGYKVNEISEVIKQKYNIDLDEKKICHIYTNVIPKIIVKQYKRNYEDWLYTYKVKGTYKMCGKCGKNKLATTTYFSVNKSSKDGLNSICKECRS